MTKDFLFGLVTILEFLYPSPTNED